MKKAVNDASLFIAYEKNLEKFIGSVVKTGIPKKQGDTQHSGGQTVFEIGVVHEFGSPSKNIPKRSFIREPIMNAQKEIIKLIERNHKKVSENAMTATVALNQLGIIASSIQKDSFSNNKWSALKPSTIKAKGSSAPLIDTGRLRNSITYIVEKG